MSEDSERSLLLSCGEINDENRDTIQVPYAVHNSKMRQRLSTSTTSPSINSMGEPELPIARAVFVVTNAALGAGMLAFPEAYGKTGGVPHALAVQTVLIVLILGAFFILGYCGQVRLTANYQDTVCTFCGPAAQIICQAVVVLYMFGSDVTYLIIIGDQLTKVIDHHGWYFKRDFIIVVISCTCVLPLCIPKKLKVISYSSMFGGLGAFIVSVIVMAQFYSGKYADKSAQKPFNVVNAFAAVPVICFGFQCHVTSVAVLAELYNPTFKRFAIVTILSTLICSVIYSITGVYGFLTFGSHVKSDVLLNYNHDDGLATAARAIVVVVVFSTYAICHFVGRSAFLGLWIKLRRLSLAQVQSLQNKRRVIVSIIWFFSSLALAIVVPTIGKAIAVVGGFAAHFIFTFPGLCLIQIALKEYESQRKRTAGLIIGVCYVVIGTFLFAQTVTQALMDDIEHKS